MEEKLVVVKISKINIQERDIIIKALNYYKLSSVEFLNNIDDDMFSTIMNIIEDSSNIHIE